VKKIYDAIVVGAGPAGCSAATFLSKRGFDVLLLDKARFPRDKICGDGISAPSLAVLDRMGVAEKVEARDFWRIDNIMVSAPNGAMFEEPNPQVPGLRDYGYVIPRRELDSILFEHARALPGVTAFEEARVTGLLREGDSVVGVVGRIDGREREVRGRYVLGADGVHSIVARQLARRNKTAAHRAFCVRAYFEGVSGLSRTIELHYDSSILPGYGWIFPTGKDTANVGVGIGLRFNQTKHIKELYRTFVEENRFAREKLGAARMVPKTMRGWSITFGSFPGPRGLGNVLLLGDAGSFIDTLTGEGIYYALEGGALAADVVTRGLRGSVREDAVGALYDRLWRRSFLWREFVPGYLMQRVFDKEPIVNRVVGVASRNRKMASTIVGFIGHRYTKASLPIRLTLGLFR